jgi:serine/threonine-protein kinase
LPDPTASASELPTVRGRAHSLGHDLPIGAVLANRYRIEGVVDRTRGLLLDAVHQELGHRVVVRVVEAGNERAIVRFQREMRALSRLESSHVARILDVGTTPEGSPYLVRERIDGASLAAQLSSRGMLPIADALLVFFQIAEAVQQAHGAGIVLRDLQPTNIYVSARKSGLHAKVADVGMCALLDDVAAPVAEPTVTKFGPSPWAAPELMTRDRRFDPRTDVWSLGCLLYEMLCGRAPFEGEGMALLASIARGEVRAPSRLRQDVPSSIDAVIARALARDPSDRFASVHEMCAALAPTAPAAARGLELHIARVAGHADRADRGDATAAAAVERAASSVPPEAGDSQFAMARSVPPPQSTAPVVAPTAPAAPSTPLGPQPIAEQPMVRRASLPSVVIPAPPPLPRFDAVILARTSGPSHEMTIPSAQASASGSVDTLPPLRQSPAPTGFDRYEHRAISPAQITADRGPGDSLPLPPTVRWGAGASPSSRRLASLSVAACVLIGFVVVFVASAPSTPAARLAAMPAPRGLDAQSVPARPAASQAAAPSASDAVASAPSASATAAIADRAPQEGQTAKAEQASKVEPIPAPRIAPAPHVAAMSAPQHSPPRVGREVAAHLAARPAPPRKVNSRSRFLRYLVDSAPRS